MEYADLPEILPDGTLKKLQKQMLRCGAGRRKIQMRATQTLRCLIINISVVIVSQTSAGKNSPVPFEIVYTGTGERDFGGGWDQR